MENVKAIEKISQAEIIEGLKKEHHKYFIIYMIGMVTGLRISDILGLQAGQFTRRIVSVTEKKTGKTKVIEFDKKIYKIIKSYIKNYNLQKKEYIVFSSSTRRFKPLSRIQAYKIMKRVFKGAKQVNCAPHSMRKTFSLNYLDSGGTIDELQQLLNHGSKMTTLSYVLDMSTLSKFLK